MEPYAIFDIESTGLSIEDSKIVCVGCYTSWDQKTHCIWMDDIHKLRQIFFRAKHVIGFNSENFDLPMMMNRHNKIFHSEDAYKYKHLDLYKIVKQRQTMFTVKFDEGFSLDKICKKLGLSRKEDGFDYKLLQKPLHLMTKEDVAVIEKYINKMLFS